MKQKRAKLSQFVWGQARSCHKYPGLEGNRHTLPSRSTAILINFIRRLVAYSVLFHYYCQEAMLLCCESYTLGSSFSGRRYYILLLKFLFFLFFLSPQDLQHGSTDKEPFQLRWSDIGVNLKIGSKIWGGDPALKFGGPQTPQCCEPKSEHVVQTYSGNRP